MNQPIDNTAKITILTTAAVQLAAILSVLVIVLKFDGSTEVTVVQALLTFMVPNALAGGAVGVAHVITTNRAKLPSMPVSVVPVGPVASTAPAAVQAAPSQPYSVPPVGPTPAAAILGG